MSIYQGTFYIRSALSQRKPVDLEASNPNGRLIEYTYHGGANQQWRLSHIQNGEFSIQNVATGTYATAQNGNNTVIRAANTNPQTNSAARWTIVRANAANDTWYIKSVGYNGKTFDVAGSSQADVTEILAYQYHGGVNQQFTLQRVGGC
ncbi:carbohydrate-binding module family 13 protein [Trichoderma evansii]